MSAHDSSITTTVTNLLKNEMVQIAVVVMVVFVAVASVGYAYHRGYKYGISCELESRKAHKVDSVLDSVDQSTRDQLVADVDSNLAIQINTEGTKPRTFLDVLMSNLDGGKRHRKRSSRARRRR